MALSKPASQGVITASLQEPFNKNDLKGSSDLKATLAFCELENLFDGLDSNCFTYPRGNAIKSRPKEGALEETQAFAINLNECFD